MSMPKTCEEYVLTKLIKLEDKVEELTEKCNKQTDIINSLIDKATISNLIGKDN